MMGTLGATPLGRLNTGTVRPEAPVPLIVLRRGTTKGLRRSLGTILTTAPNELRLRERQIERHQFSHPVHAVQRRIEA